MASDLHPCSLSAQRWRNIRVGALHPTFSNEDNGVAVWIVDVIRWDEKAGLRQNAIRSQVIDAPKAQEIEDLFSKSVKDVFFDYDKSAIRPGEVPTVQNDEAFLSQHPSIKVLIEGHCDDRGSEEYNIALGTSSAESVKRALAQEGIPADRIRTISFGKEKNLSVPRTTNSAGCRTGSTTSYSNAERL